MLRTNLSTRPYYNEHAIRVGIGAIVVFAAALSAFNAAQIFSFNDRNSEFVEKAEASEARARELRDQARQTTQALNRTELDAVQAAAREANLLIDRRAFSWTELFNRFEETLPADVRIVAVTPQVDREGRLLVAVTVISRRIAHLDSFIDRLEETGAFAEMIPRQDAALEDGTLQSIIQGYYRPSARVAAAVSTPPSSDSSGAAKNDSGQKPAPEGGAR